MSDPRIAHALFCDEIRFDADGRGSYIGERTGELTFKASRRGSEVYFGVVAWLICDPEDVPSRISVRIYGPPGRRLLSGNEMVPAAPPRRPDSTKAFYRFAIERIALPLSQEGDVEVSIETETGVLRAGRLRLRFVA